MRARIDLDHLRGSAQDIFLAPDAGYAPSWVSMAIEPQARKVAKPAQSHQALKASPFESAKAQTKTAALILEHSVESANSLWAAYDLARVNRGKPRGITTDQEQDLLRAMVIAAASGLDACLKRLIRDCLPRLITDSGDVHDAFEKFVARHLQSGEGVISVKLLAKTLAAGDAQRHLIEQYVYDLTGDSLQSADQLLRACSAVGADSKTCVGDIADVKKIFAARNQMVHELDMNLDHPIRKRRVRTQADMKRYAERLLAISRAIVCDVDKRVEV